jgi:hypothetical protein
MIVCKTWHLSFATFSFKLKVSKQVVHWASLSTCSWSTLTMSSCGISILKKKVI